LRERFAVPEYWIVDPDLDASRVFRLVEGRYQRVQGCRSTPATC
jgi:Uma2 family endonuclease